MASTTATKRINGIEACGIIGCCPATLWKLGREELFTIDYPHGRGRGKPCFYHRDEIELYRDSRNKDTVRAFRKKHKRI